MTNKQSVEIYGQQYKMVGQATSNRMREVAVYVDEKMKEMSNSNPRLDSTRIAVLSAVNIADEYIKLKSEHDEIMELINETQP